MKFFNIDCHISVIRDVKDIFSELGHQVDSWCISGHNWVMNNPSPKVDIISSENWHSINDDMCERFYQRYKQELSEYDGFIVTYPPVFVKLFEKFSKPIIMYVPIRYEVPYTNKPIEWEKFNNFLRNGIDSKLIIPVANSIYEKKYSEYFLKRDFHYIPNICEYTKNNWQPKNDMYLYFSKFQLKTNSSNLYDKRLLGRYNWSTLAKFKGIVNIPYNCSTMSIFEHYTANIPMFFPTPQFLLELYQQYPKDGILSEISWNQVLNLPPGSYISADKDDPNLYNNIDVIKKWIMHSDFYNTETLPHIQYFGSFDEMEHILNVSDVQSISANMRKQNILKRQKVYEAWNNIIKAYY